jgi:outer membrane biosynthesis protein TonB
VRTQAELKRQMAQRLVQAHPDSTYLSRAPDRLYAIPVLEVELHADGSVRRIEVLRHPSTGNRATQLAIAAVRRAAPYGDISRVPKPWKVVEAFLFNDELRFKPRTLDLE